jgi:hypothetical protein
MGELGLSTTQENLWYSVYKQARMNTGEPVNYETVEETPNGEQVL